MLRTSRDPFLYATGTDNTLLKKIDMTDRVSSVIGVVSGSITELTFYAAFASGSAETNFEALDDFGQPLTRACGVGQSVQLPVELAGAAFIVIEADATGVLRLGPKS